MSVRRQDYMSQLFLVRLQAEDTTESPQPESKRWSGRVQHVVTGEAYEFSGWTELVERLCTMLDDAQASSDIEA